VDKNSQEALPNALVKIEGTYFETTTNSAGEFSIIGIDAGTYSVSAQMEGYIKLTCKDFSVYPDILNEINFEISSQGTSDENFVLNAQPFSLKSDDPYMRRLVNTKTFNRQTNRSLNDIILQSSGDVYQRTFAPSLPLGERYMRTDELFFRGGAAREAGYYMNGIRLTDANTGANFLTLPYGAMEQIVVQTGGYDAKYGQFGTGMTQIVPKRGGDAVAGSGEVITSTYETNVYSLSLGGPISKHIRFYAALDYSAAEDAEPGVFGNPMVRFSTGGIRNLSSAINDTAIFATDQNGNLKYKRGARPDRVNASDLTNFYGNVSYSPNAAMQFDLTTLFSSIKRNQFSSHILLSPSGVPREERSTYAVNLTGKYFLSSAMFLQGHIGMYSSDDKIAARSFFEMGDKAITFLNASIRGNTGSTTYYGDNFLYDIDRGFLGYKKSESDAWFGGINFNWQWNKEHFIESGFEFSANTERLLDITDIGNPIGGANNIYGYRIFMDDQNRIAVKHQDKNDPGALIDGPKTPKTAAFFIQDKYAIEKFKVSGGMRVDYFSNGVKSVDPRQFGFIPLQVGQKLNESKSYIKWSPRLGLSAEFSKNVIVRANYGWFNHLPAFENYLVSRNMVERLLVAPPFKLYVPNPVLEPEKTEAIELGINYSSSSVVCDASYFRNNVSGVIMKGQQPARNTLWTLDNSGSSIVTGINFHFEDRISDNFSAGSFVTFLKSKTSSNELGSGFRSDWLMDGQTQIDATSDHEQRTTLKFFAEGRLLKGDGPLVADGRPLQNASLFVWINWASGFPYTPTAVSRYIFAGTPTAMVTGERNSRSTPSTMTVDLKVTKEFDITDRYRATLYIEILNLLNRKNPIQVFSATGEADNDGYLATPDAQTLNTRQRQQYQYLMKNSLYYSDPRLVNLGLKIEF
ncbi:TonB-dependent receptor, partial [bacterium]|nr:TonB-dependent receptor [bacterium]